MNKATFRGKAKEQWGELSKDRLDRIAAKRDRLEGEIRQVYAIIKQVTEKQVREFNEINRH
ncbi:CsbD family protein [Marinobacter changyiensis]|uniref:CsbD family protein n=1 Tax=Marinobacter changyiensis TaxID=2604091 RepID=UPI001C55369D|nr:CsbD family protein [Marinobacter changyiensis]